MLNVVHIYRFLLFFKQIKWKGLVGPIIILMILAMMILPLPAFILDIFFTFNISISIMVLLVSMFTRNILEFSAFPTVLLFSTLLRLSLNIASTRIILLKGHMGPFSAGRVVEAFGHFLVGGDFAIGIIVFFILVIINFMVITKGAGRIAEVGARFALDGMPGKQMAIDSDLNVGIIGEKQAKIRRMEITQEADFYGAMDGASKFVRGDAISGIVIMIINILGGLVVGVIQHHMTLSEAGKIYTLLTIGDGLVAQIPALVISTAAGVIVTRVSSNQDVGEQMINQIFYNPKVIFFSSLVLGILGIVPGMPNVIFFPFTLILMMIAYFLHLSQEKNKLFKKNQHFCKKKIIYNVSWDNVVLEDPMRVELGYSLFSMTKIQNDSNLLFQISEIRKEIAKKIGFLPPMIHVKYNNYLSALEYRIFIKGVEHGRGTIVVNNLIAINKKNILDTLSGIKVVDPIFGYPAFWIDIKYKNQAQHKKYHVIHADLVIKEHLINIISLNLKDLFSRQEAQQLLNYISLKIPKLPEELIPNIISLTCLHKVLQNLLFENIPIRDICTILETLIEYGIQYQNPNELTSFVRLSLHKLITQTFFSSKKVVYVIGLEKKLEYLLLQIIQSGKDTLNTQLHKLFIDNTNIAIQNQISINAPLIIIVKHEVRFLVSSLLRKYFLQLIVLSDLEITNNVNIIFKNIIKM
ncbi:flagellar biosynthesis protein FlhA [Buchnera aphidicola]|uniref:flagellar biosynthesis protein FlhA n=1 Tax=Buchnera aphidicola TaxID=9 RepID=UPI003464C8F1